MVSPWKTGLGNSIFSKPRLPTVVPIVVSPTDRPTAIPSVSRLLTSGLPNSALEAAWKSTCSGCGFMVRHEKKTLSDSVMVRPGSCWNVAPTSSSSKYLPAIGPSWVDAMVSHPAPALRLHAVQAERAQQRNVLHRVEEGGRGAAVGVGMERARRHREEIALAPFVTNAVDVGGAGADHDVIDRARRLAMGARAHARPQHLQIAAQRGHDRPSGGRIAVFHDHVVEGIGG